MNRFRSTLDGVHGTVILELCDAVGEAASEHGDWIIHNEKIAFRASNGEVYDFDFAKDDRLSRAIVDFFNNAAAISRNASS